MVLPSVPSEKKRLPLTFCLRFGCFGVIIENIYGEKHSHADKGMREFLSGDFFMGEAFRLWFSLCKNEGKINKSYGVKKC